MIRSRAVSSLLLIFAVACTTARAKAADSGVTGPQLVTRAPLSMNFSEADAAAPLYADIEVVIDSTGVPVMSTSKRRDQQLRQINSPFTIG